MGYSIESVKGNKGKSKEDGRGFSWAFQAARAYWIIRVYTARQQLLSRKIKRMPSRYAKFDAYSNQQLLELLEGALTWSNPYLDAVRSSAQFADDLPSFLRLPPPADDQKRFSWAGNAGNRQLLRDGMLPDEPRAGMSYGEREVAS